MAPTANTFINALNMAISRYMGTMRMAGSVQKYRDSGICRVIGFVHMVAKGRALQGQWQWFYCNNNAATRHMWFHLVRDLVCSASKDGRINVVDLGPSRSNTFTELKMKYGFKSLVYWPAVSD